MKNKHIFWGILLISIGIFILINNITPYNFYFEEVWKLWPVVLILWGISLMVRQTVIRTILIALTAFAFAFAIYSTVRTGFRIFDHRFHFNGYENDDYSNDSIESNAFSEGFNNQTKATLNFDAGAGSFIINDSSGDLFSAVTKGTGNNYTLDRIESGGETTIDFMMRKKRFSFMDGKYKNEVRMKLHTSPVWDINMNVGAASVDFDLSEYKIGKIKIDMGAASLKVILGEPEKDTFFELDAGVSSIDIVVPGNAGCEIRSDISLSSKDFEGFKKVDDNLYRTENFDSAEKKIYLDFDTGVSSIKVRRSSGW